MEKKQNEVRFHVGFKERSKILLERQLRRVAAFLQGQMSGLPLVWQKRILIIYFLIAAGTSIGVSYCSLSPSRKGFAITPIKPVLIFPRQNDAPNLSIKEYQRIRGWRLYLDSLQANQSETNLHKKSPFRGPSLRDTLIFLEQLYVNQQKNQT
jgi:hypothetical protein